MNFNTPIELDPRTRTVLRATAMFLGLVAVAGLAVLLVQRVVVRHRLTAAKAALERELGSLDPRVYVPEPPPGDNPFRRVLAAARSLPSSSDRPWHDTGRLLAFGDPSAWPSAAAVEAWRQRSEQALVALHSIGDCSRARLEIDYGVSIPGPPDVISPLRAASVLLADARWALVQGEAARALASAEPLACLAATFEREPLLDSQFIASVVQRELAALAATAIATPTGADTLARLAEMLRGLGGGDRFRFALRYEAAAYLRAIESTASPERLRHERWLGRIARREEAVSIAAGLAQGYLAAARSLDRPFASFDPKAILPPERSSLTLDELLDLTPIWDTILSDALDDARTIRAAETTRRLAVAALEVRRQALIAGTYPEALPDLPELSSPEGFTGGMAAYARRPDGGATLAHPDARRAWEDYAGATSDANPPRFVWELPPVPGSPK